MSLDLPADLRARVDAARAEMDAERAALPADEAARDEALAHCRSALARRPLTRHELARKLAAKGCDDALAAWAVSRCEANGLVDDAAWARQFVASRIGRGHGERRIRQDLTVRGIARELQDAALEGAGGREAAGERAVEVLRRRFDAGALAEEKGRAKAFRFLAGRGYDAGQAHDAIRAVRAGAEDA